MSEQNSKPTYEELEAERDVLLENVRWALDDTELAHFRENALTIAGEWAGEEEADDVTIARAEKIFRFIYPQAATDLDALLAVEAAA